MPRNVASLAMHGRLVFIAFQRGAEANVNVRDLMHRRLKLIGTTLRSRSADYKAQLMARLGDRVWPLFERGRVKTVIAERFALDRAADAHRLMASSRHIGKILLTT